MGIFSRFSDIVNSNLTAILDKAEDPEKMMRLMIQEMQETLVEIRSDAARIIADRKEAARTLGRLEDAQGEWQRKAELAIAKDREDLAKGALLEKAKLEEPAGFAAGTVVEPVMGQGKQVANPLCFVHHLRRQWVRRTEFLLIVHHRHDVNILRRVSTHQRSRDEPGAATHDEPIWPGISKPEPFAQKPERLVYLLCIHCAHNVTITTDHKWSRLS